MRPRATAACTRTQPSVSPRERVSRGTAAFAPRPALASAAAATRRVARSVPSSSPTRAGTEPGLPIFPSAQAALPRTPVSNIDRVLCAHGRRPLSSLVASPRSVASWGVASAAAGPMPPRALAAAPRTRGSASPSRSRSAGTHCFAAVPTSPTASAAATRMPASLLFSSGASGGSVAGPILPSTPAARDRRPASAPVRYSTRRGTAGCAFGPIEPSTIPARLATCGSRPPSRLASRAAPSAPIPPSERIAATRSSAAQAAGAWRGAAGAGGLAWPGAAGPSVSPGPAVSSAKTTAHTGFAKRFIALSSTSGSHPAQAQNGALVSGSCTAPGPARPGLGAAPARSPARAPALFGGSNVVNTGHVPLSPGPPGTSSLRCECHIVAGARERGGGGAVTSASAAPGA